MESKRVHPRRIPLIFWIVTPVLLAGLLFCGVIIGYWGPSIVSQMERRTEAELRVASYLGLSACEASFDYLLELRMEDDPAMVSTLRAETLAEIKAVSKRFHDVHMMVVDHQGRLVGASVALPDDAAMPSFPKNDPSIELYHLDGRTIRAHARYFPFWKWTIVAFMWERDFQAPLVTTKKIIYGGTIGIFLVAVLTLVAAFHRFVNRPIRRLIHAAEDVGEGQFKKVPVEENNEIGTLARVFNRMVDNLEHQQQKLQSMIATLDENRRFLNAVFESLQDGISVLDLDLTIRYVNGKMEAWYAEDLPLVGRKCFEVYRKAEEPCPRCPALRCITSGTVETETLPEVREGNGRWFEVYTYPIRDKDGKVSGVVEFVRDITEKRKAEEALKASEERYRNLVENSSDAILMLDTERKIISCNRASLELFGYTMEEMLGQSARLIHPSEGSFRRYGEEIYPVIRRRGFHRTEWEFMRKDGSLISTEVVNSVVRDQDGRILGYVGVIRDITERKELEAQLRHAQKMEAIGTLAGGIAHDFNNLLQAILANTQMLSMQKDPDDPDMPKLKAIEQTVRRANELTQQLLTFGRKVESQLQPVDLNREVRQVAELLQRTVPKMIEIELELAEEACVVQADPVQIEQVLMNLAINAQDAMPDGGRLKIETRRVELGEEFCRNRPEVEPGPYVLLRVSDTGHGMDEEVLGHIFEPFFTTKDRSRGTGLGLSMVYGIVRSHRGYIECRSKPGQGTVFDIYFPMSSMPADPVTDGEEEPQKEMPEGTETVLLVEDEPMLRELGAEILEQAGYSVLLAASGEEALETFRKANGTIDLVILDLIMPGMGGAACLEALLRLDRNAKIVVASGYSTDGSAKDMIEMGAKAFIQKPYSVKDMVRTIREVLDG